MNKSKETEFLSEMYRRYNYHCFVDRTKRADQRAHIIGNTKLDRRVYGQEIIDNPLNWLPAHGLANNALIDAGCNHELKKQIARCIVEGDRAEIERLVRENIARKRSKTE